MRIYCGQRAAHSLDMSYSPSVEQWPVLAAAALLSGPQMLLEQLLCAVAAAAAS